MLIGLAVPTSRALPPEKMACWLKVTASPEAMPAVVDVTLALTPPL